METVGENNGQVAGNVDENFTMRVEYVPRAKHDPEEVIGGYEDFTGFTISDLAKSPRALECMRALVAQRRQSGSREPQRWNNYLEPR